MELEARIAAALPARSGQSANGEWKSQEYILEYIYFPNQTTPSKAKMSLSGKDRIEKYNIQVGDEVKVRYHIEARTYNGQWYNDVRIDSVTFVGASANKNQPTEAPAPQQEGYDENGNPLPL